MVGPQKTECVKIDGALRTVDALKLATLSWVHWYNDNRLHSSIGYLIPAKTENVKYREITFRRRPLLGERPFHRTRVCSTTRADPSRTAAPNSDSGGGSCFLLRQPNQPTDDGEGIDPWLRWPPMPPISFEGDRHSRREDQGDHEDGRTGCECKSHQGTRRSLHGCGHGTRHQNHRRDENPQRSVRPLR
ncbi:MAG: integrase core domain-containing protein [Microbacteriaceae bacterium]|nr:integrase core domain-containing protein [Microbacteriaceae bacterium]